MTTTQLSIVQSPTTGVSTRVEGWECGLVTPEIVWKGVIGAVRAVIAGDDQRELIKITVGGDVLSDHAVMPAPDGSESPDEWLTRMQQKFGAETPILLYARELPTHERSLFDLLVSAFGRPVFEEHGLVRGNIDIEVFLGEYRATPGGIHREQCGNSHFVLQGRKYMHFWHGEDWIPKTAGWRAAEGDNAIDPEEYLPSLQVPEVVDCGTSLIASAGEFFTWDPGTWHVAETVGPAFAVNIARYTRSFIPGEGTYPFAAEPDGRVSIEWLEGYRDFLGGGADLALALAAASAYGLAGADPECKETTDPRRVAVSSHARRLWHETRGSVQVAAHGRSGVFSASVLPWLVGLADLPYGAECEVPVDPDTRALARFLVENNSLRAVQGLV
ncbi:hypothetical protein QNO09_00700 [Streptomyces sp. 378]|uniref:hypothetical protein n=1 Tax=Streptomyces sp. 378 TaxID=3049412 RepID=UPI0024C22AA4|nr:hypothetical protein [Streptomyces sp. 378]MDK1341862.1 hypothetical protein [Streptomyces sp. 378]